MAERQALELATNNAWLCPDKNKQLPGFAAKGRAAEPARI